MPSYPLLRANEDQDVIQIDNNMQTFAMVKEQNRFSEGCENPRGCGKPKRQNPSIDKAHYAKQNVRNDDDA